jgi:ribose transport system ATP-binding protein
MTGAAPGSPASESAELKISDLDHAFGQTVVFHDAAFSFKSGRLYGVVGPNGAGKTTLMRILAGLQRPGRGEVTFAGATVPLGNASRCRAAGISYISQELSLIDAWTVGEQLKHELRDGQAIDRALLLLELFETPLTLQARVGGLSADERQVLEIAKGLARPADILLLDEPTTGLTVTQRGTLYGEVLARAARGALAIIVSHDRERLDRAANDIVIVAEGKIVDGDRQPSRRALTRSSRAPTSESDSAPDLAIDFGNGIVIEARAGDCIGLTGALKVGVHEFLRRAYGLVKPAPNITYLRHRWRAGLRRSRSFGLAYLSRNRNTEWGFPDQPLWFTVSAASAAELAPFTIIRRSDERHRATASIEEMAVTPPDIDLPLAHFSGGNRQKILLATMMSSRAQILLFDEPLSGIDAQARQRLASAVKSASERGLITFVYSQEREDLRLMCTKVVEIN